MKSTIYYDPLDRACKSEVGGVAAGKEITFQIFCVQSSVNTPPSLNECLAGKEKAYFVLNKDGEDCVAYPMQNNEYGWSISLKINEVGLYFYRFRIEGEGDVCANQDNYGQLHCQNGSSFLLTVYKKSYRTPKWFKGGVMYQIFPDRFAKQGSMPDITGRIRREDWGGEPSYQPNKKGKVLNNDFFGGNFKGVQSKLPYLKSLGVTVIYFNPVFEAASNHRYDTSDYLKIDPFLGEKSDFEELVEEAKKQGIRVILDGVFNHTGDNSVYFNKYGAYPSIGAYQSKDSPYYSWYSFQNFPDKYSSWWGIDILPEVNESSEEYQQFIFGEDGVLKTWLKSGIGGYRLDVADELPDFFLEKLRKSVKSGDKEAIIIGEVWEDASDKISYSERKKYLQGKELDSVMNYPWKDAIINYLLSEKSEVLLRAIRLIIDHYPKQTVDCLMNILGTHDTPRILTVLGGIHCNNKEEMALKTAYLTPENKQKAIEKLKMAALLQFTLPGVPCIYYGDENGMEGHIDPFCRRCFDWERLNESLIAYYKQLGEIREEHKDIFSDGEWKEVCCKDGLLIFKRVKKNKEIYIYANNCSKSYLFEKQGKYQNLLCEETFEDDFEIQPYTFGIFKSIV